MAGRFYVASPIAADRATLDGGEAHHLIHVMRAQLGDEVTLFDGGGTEFTAKIAEIGRTRVELHVLDRREIDREAPRAVVLGVALPKGERRRWLIEKTVEIGVQCLVPLKTARGVAQPTETALDRLRSAVVQASKQCGRNRLMRIGQPQEFDDYIANVPPTAAALIAHPGGEVNIPVTLRVTNAITRSVMSTLSEVRLAVGPEGGFTDEEVARAVELGWQTVDLGPRTLRIETAALVLATLATR